VSPAAQEFAKTAFHLDTEVLPCPTDLDRFREGRKLPEYDDDKTNIVFMGRLVKRKGCRYLLDAIESLDISLRSRTRILIAGRGPLLGELQSQTKKAGLEDIVSFLGFVEDEDKPDLLASADIAAFPSTGGESFGIMLLEAMASGSGVVIGGDNDGYRYVLNDRAELLFDPKDVGGFSRTLTDLILKPEKRASLRDYQQELVKEYDIGVLGPRMMEIYMDSLA
jgi:phosphatidylinositol alpha-mannosyltransferase